MREIVGVAVSAAVTRGHWLVVGRGPMRHCGPKAGPWNTFLHDVPLDSDDGPVDRTAVSKLLAGQASGLRLIATSTRCVATGGGNVYIRLFKQSLVTKTDFAAGATMRTCRHSIETRTK